MRELYFMQSDHELMQENMAKLEQLNLYLMGRVSEEKGLKEQLAERETEVRLLKRERDE